MNQRQYNKIFVKTNRGENHEKISLGYQYDEKELTFKKDVETYFHVPSYTTPLELIKTDLIKNGAQAGIFPAASDRIFKDLKNYGDVTFSGSPSKSYTTNGMWFCSWLKYDPITKEIQWMDRYYNPGKFNYQKAQEDLTTLLEYEKSDNIFVDLPSTLILEPSVRYKYFHVGEKTFDFLITTFGGISGERLKLHLNNWGEEDVDTFNSSLVKINTNAPSIQTITSNVKRNKPSDKVLRIDSSLDYNNSFNTNAFLNYDPDIFSDKEFSWSFWSYSENWFNNITTQLIGNYSLKGGVGLFLEKVHFYPFFIIPETEFGHLLYVNPNIEGYLDKPIKINERPISPACFAIDSQNNAIICSNDRSGVIYKINHIGQVIKSTKNIYDESTNFVFPFGDEEPKQMLCSPNDEVFILTNRGYYSFDKDFRLLKEIPLSNNPVGAFSYNSKEKTTLFRTYENVNDLKFIEEDAWYTKDNILYKNDVIVKTFDQKATTIAIDPNERVWVCHGKNEITIIDSNNDLNQKTIFVGSDEIIEDNQIKSLTFFEKFIRDTNTTKWFALVFYSGEKKLYLLDLNGDTKTFVDAFDLFDYKLLETSEQRTDQLKFHARGDMSGYESKRIKNKISDNKISLSLKVSGEDISKQTKTFATLQTDLPTNKWSSNSWIHFLVTFKHNNFKLYVDGSEVLNFVLPKNIKISYVNQPSFFLGNIGGDKLGLNAEIQYPVSLFNGKIADVRVYDYEIKSFLTDIFRKSSVVSNDLLWSIPTPSMQFIEEIDRFFKHKLPGAKSQFFNINLYNTKITDHFTQKILEAELRELIVERKPAHADLYKINWIS